MCFSSNNRFLLIETYLVSIQIQQSVALPICAMIIPPLQWWGNVLQKQ